MLTTHAHNSLDSEDDYTAQVVETSVTVNNNSPIQDYIHPDDHAQPGACDRGGSMNF